MEQHWHFVLQILTIEDRKGHQCPESFQKNGNRYEKNDLVLI